VRKCSAQRGHDAEQSLHLFWYLQIARCALSPDLASCRLHLRTLRAGRAWRALAYRDTDTLRGPPDVTPAKGARKVHTADPLSSGRTLCLPCVVVYASHHMSSRACAYLHVAPEKTMRA
jgi:hypothetical protein